MIISPMMLFEFHLGARAGTFSAPRAILEPHRDSPRFKLLLLDVTERPVLMPWRF